MVDNNSKKINFEDFLKLYPPLTKLDKSNYKTFNNYFKKREKKDIKKDEDKNNNTDRNNINNNMGEKDENINNLETDRSNKSKIGSNEEEWYLVNKGIDLQNKKRKRTNDIRQALESFFNESDLISKLSKFFHEFQSLLTQESTTIINNKKDEKKEQIQKSYLRLPSFIKDKDIEEKILIKIQGITNKLTDSVKFLKCEENYYIIRMFEIGEQCYFLLNGRLSVLKPVEYKNVKITYEQYFIYLMTLYHYKEYDLIEELIEINKKYVNIHYLDNLLIFVKAYFIVKLNNDINDMEEVSIKYIDTKLKDFYLSYEDYALKRAEIVYQINQIKYNNNSKNSKVNSEIKKYFLSIFKPSIDDSFIMNQYKFLFDEKYEKESPGCSLLKYEIFIFLYPGAFFGETALENNRKRNASIRTEEECIILSLSNEAYRNLLSDDNKRLKSLDIAFICNNFFFNNISPVLFDKYYFPYFKAIFNKKDDILYRQGDEISSVYLLKEGEVKFEIFCSILDLYNIIKNYLFAIINNNNFFQLNEEYIKKLKEKYLNDSFYFNLRNKNEAFKEQLKIKKKMFVYICNTYDCCGLIEYFLDINYNMTCHVNSLKAKLFEINKYNLEKIINGEKQIVSTYNQFVCNILLLQIKRLNNIKEDNIKQIEYKIKEKIYDDTKNMNYYIKGQTGISKPYKKEKIKIKPLYLEDNTLINNSNKIISNLPKKILENNINERIKYTITEPNLMQSINNINNNKYKNRYDLIGKINNNNNELSNKLLKINNNIKISKKEKNIINILSNKNKNRYNSDNKYINIHKNVTSKTIINCGRKFLSLKQIENKIRSLKKDMYEYNQIKSEESIYQNNNNKEVNHISFYNNEFGLNQNNIRYDTLKIGDIFKISKYSVRPNNFYDSFGASFKNCFRPNVSQGVTNRRKFWKIRQMNNDEMRKLNTNPKLMNTVFIRPINTKRKEKSTVNNKIIKNNTLNQTSDFKIF